MKETCMCWGLECGDGWYNLIDTLCYMLQFNTDHNRYPQVEATQVKEKFGGLCFYYQINAGKEPNREHKCGYIAGLVSFAEFMSNKTCEECGSIDNVKQTKGWITTLCEECMKVKNG